MTESYDNPSTRPPGTVPTDDGLDAPLRDSTLPPSYPAGSGGYESGATYATTGTSGHSGQHVASGSEGSKVDDAKAKVDDAKAKAGEVTDQVKGEAQNVKQTAAEAGGRVAGTAKEEAAHVAGEAKRQAKDVVQQARTQLASQASTGQQSLAGVIRSLGGELSTMAGATEQPGVASNLAQQASGVVDSVADWFESREPADVVAELTAFARRRPGAFLGIAAAAGLVAGRLARSLKDDASDDAATQPEHLSSGYTTEPDVTRTTDAYATPTTDPYVPPTAPSFPPTSSGAQGGTYPAPGTTTGGYGGTP